MKLPTKKQFFGFVDMAGVLQGQDRDSGGYPYSASHFHNVYLWELDDEERARRYIHTINFGGDKGYKLVKILISVEDALA